MANSAKTAASYEFSLESVELSDWVRSASLVMGREAVDGSAMGDVSVANYGGLYTWSVEAQFNAHTTAIDTLINSLVGVTSGVAWTMRETTAAASTSNPQYSGTVVITNFQPFAGSVGEMRIASVSCAAHSALTRSES